MEAGAGVFKEDIYPLSIRSPEKKHRKTGNSYIYVSPLQSPEKPTEKQVTVTYTPLPYGDTEK